MSRCASLIIIVALICLAGIAQTPIGGPSSPGATSQEVSIEVMVTAIDSKGAPHNIDNFGQILTVGQKWSSDLGADVKAQVTWSSSYGAMEPTITLTIEKVGPKGQRVRGVATLVKGVWDTLYGPEMFKTTDGKPLMLPDVGYPVAVASVSPVAKRSTDG